MSRFDTVATVTVTAADGTKLVDIKVAREDVTTTNGAYRCIRDTAVEEITNALKAFLATYRAGGDIDDGVTVSWVSAAVSSGEDVGDWFKDKATV